MDNANKNQHFWQLHRVGLSWGFVRRHLVGSTVQSPALCCRVGLQNNQRLKAFSFEKRAFTLNIYSCHHSLRYVTHSVRYYKQSNVYRLCSFHALYNFIGRIATKAQPNCRRETPVVGKIVTEGKRGLCQPQKRRK